MNRAIHSQEGENHARRDRLLAIQDSVQKIWKEEKAQERSLDPTKKKYFSTIPYPYINARLHLGHGFTYIKADIYTRFKSAQGYNALFPLGFHGTGMPIYAAAKKLEFELETIGVEKLMENAKARREEKSDVKIAQFEIMLISGVPLEDIPKFVDPLHWLRYFPAFVREDLEKFGMGIDFSRSFVTTEMNSYYDSFIRWQFEELRKGSFIKFGHRASIYSIKDSQMCADHDRSAGEGVLPQEFTLIMLELTSFESAPLRDLRGKYPEARVVLPAATLRPETVYGQTNCFVHPTGKYGAFLMNNNDVWICTERAVRNAAYQGQTATRGKYTEVCALTGRDLIGEAIKAPLSKYPQIFVWPMLTLDMDKGTGVVTSVPSDSPDDYAVLVDLKKKRELREKYGLKDEQVLPFAPVEIIDIPGYSRLSAVTAYEAYNITSMNDREKLAQAKAEVYTKGFYSGKLLLGQWAGQPVSEVKSLVRENLMASQMAVKYWEPEKLCISRTGDVCIVALLDQWFINYGEPSAETHIKNHVKESTFCTFNESVRNLTMEGIEWLREWGCSRSYGLGTRIPWDKQFVIESLSDSTIYMAYYTVAHMLHKDVFGKEIGELQIPAEDMQHCDWSTIFFGLPRDPQSRIDEEKLQKMRESFLYWYPVDMRFSGKDLAKNHLIMCLYNHEFIWGRHGQNMLPRGYYLNGIITIDGRKMSKQEGNFITLREALEKFGADATRLMLASAGDSLDDANVVLAEGDNAILRLYALESWLRDIHRGFSGLRRASVPETEFFDRAFESETHLLLCRAEESYESMTLREAVKAVFFTLATIKEDYRLNCGVHGMHGPLLQNYIRGLLIALCPLTPHFSEMMWIEHYLPLLNEEEARTESNRCRHAHYPAVGCIDHKVLRQRDFLRKTTANILSGFEKATAKKKAVVKNVFVVCGAEFKVWQKRCLELLLNSPENLKDCVKAAFSAEPHLFGKAMEFITFRTKQQISNPYADEIIDELALFTSHRALLQRDLKGCTVTIISAKEAMDHPNKMVAQAADNALPGSPQIVIDY